MLNKLSLPPLIVLPFVPAENLKMSYSFESESAKKEEMKKVLETFLLINLISLPLLKLTAYFFLNHYSLLAR